MSPPAMLGVSAASCTWKAQLKKIICVETLSSAEWGFFHSFTKYFMEHLLCSWLWWALELQRREVTVRIFREAFNILGVAKEQTNAFIYIHTWAHYIASKLRNKESYIWWLIMYRLVIAFLRRSTGAFILPRDHYPNFSLQFYWKTEKTKAKTDCIRDDREECTWKETVTWGLTD